MAKTPGMKLEGPLDWRPIWLWIVVLSAVCGATALLVLLGMPVGEAVMAVGTLTAVASGVVFRTRTPSTEGGNGSAVVLPTMVPQQSSTDTSSAAATAEDKQGR